MARIDVETMERINKERNFVHDRVATTYCVFVKDGEKFFQIDTYGKCSRVFSDKISQSLQIDKDAAVVIVNALKKEFEIE